MDTNNVDAKQLMIRAKEGDQKAFDKLYELFLKPIYRYIYLRTGDKQTSEDLAQTVFIKVFQSLPRYQDRGKPLLAYFFTIARNTIIDFVRRERNSDSPAPEELEQEPDRRKAGVAEEVDARLKQDLVLNHMKDLSRDQHDVLLLKYIEGYTNKEIAAMLGKSEMAVRQLQCRGLKGLREFLKDKLA